MFVVPLLLNYIDILMESTYILNLFYKSDVVLGANTVTYHQETNCPQLRGDS